MDHQSVLIAGKSPAKVTSMRAREAFCEAVELLASWMPGEKEPTIPYENDDITLTSACKIVQGCNATLPKPSQKTLRFCDIEPTGKTYDSASRAVLTRIKEFRRKQ